MHTKEAQTPLLSVVVAVYNAEKTLSCCLDSILSQQTSSFEALCIDDGSTDRSGQILDEYARLDARIKVFHIENHGLSFVRNYAIENARGAYIGFVDSDDWIDSDHFSNLLRYFEDPTVDLVIGRIRFERLGSCNQNCEKTNIPNGEVFKELTRKETFEALILDPDIYGFCHSKIFKREKIKFDFDENVALAEDTTFCCQYAYEIQKTILVNRRTYHYVIADYSSTNMFKSTSRITGLRAAISTIDVLSKDDELVVCRDRVIWTLLNWYFIFFSHYSQIGDKGTLKSINKYKPEIRKYLRLFRSSRNYGFISKVVLFVKIYVPYLWIFASRVFKKRSPCG